MIGALIPCHLIHHRFSLLFSAGLANDSHLLYSKMSQKTRSKCAFSGTYRIKQRELHSHFGYNYNHSRYVLNLCTESILIYRGNFCLISYCPNFFTICMYSPKSITWTVPATQNISVWYDQRRPSSISGQVKPSVWITFKFTRNNNFPWLFYVVTDPILESVIHTPYLFELSFWFKEFHINSASKIDQS